jgi:glycosyltransferase involved in cell wall biosynthesis
LVTGFVEDVRKYIAQSSVFICPQNEGTGIKNKILEAMAMGKSVATTTIGAFGIDAVHGKEIIIADDSKKFAIEVMKLIETKTYRDEIGCKARNFIEKKYSWEIASERINNIFVEMVN